MEGLLGRCPVENWIWHGQVTGSFCATVLRSTLVVTARLKKKVLADFIRTLWHAECRSNGSLPQGHDNVKSVPVLEAFCYSGPTLPKLYNGKRAQARKLNLAHPTVQAIRHASQRLHDRHKLSSHLRLLQNFLLVSPRPPTTVPQHKKSHRPAIASCWNPQTACPNEASAW